MRPCNFDWPGSNPNTRKPCSYCEAGTIDDHPACAAHILQAEREHTRHLSYLDSDEAWELARAKSLSKRVKRNPND